MKADILEQNKNTERFLDASIYAHVKKNYVKHLD